MYLGDYIVIEEQLGPFEFRCESVSTGTPFTATVDEDKRKVFSDFSFPKAHPHACRFLRPDGDLVRCTIHRDSPAQCKFYRCTVSGSLTPGEIHLATSPGPSPSILTTRGSGRSGRKWSGNGRLRMKRQSRGSRSSWQRQGTGCRDGLRRTGNFIYF